MKARPPKATLRAFFADCKFLFPGIGRFYKGDVSRLTPDCPTLPDFGWEPLHRVWHGMCNTKNRSRERSCIEPGARKGWNRFRRSLAEGFARYRRERTRPEQGRTVILVASNVQQCLDSTDRPSHRLGPSFTVKRARFIGVSTTRLERAFFVAPCRVWTNFKSSARTMHP